MERLQAIMTDNEAFLVVARAERQERNLTQALRQEQDEAYLESLRADQQKEENKRRQRLLEEERLRELQQQEEDEQNKQQVLQFFFFFSRILRDLHWKSPLIVK